MFNFRIINTPDGNQIIDETLKTPYDSITPVEMMEYIEVDARLISFDKLVMPGLQKKRLAAAPGGRQADDVRAFGIFYQGGQAIRIRLAIQSVIFPRHLFLVSNLQALVARLFDLLAHDVSPELESLLSSRRSTSAAIKEEQLNLERPPEPGAFFCYLADFLHFFCVRQRRSIV